MNGKLNILLLAILAVALYAPPAYAGDTFIVVVHKDNPVDSMDRKELSDLFLRFTSRFSSGEEAVPIDLKDGSSTREAFSKSVHKRSTKAVKWYWQKRRFAVGGNAPGQATSETNLLRFLATNTRAIGYVSVNTDIEAFPVKLIRITD